VPVTTEDCELFVRDTPRNQQKIHAFAERFGERAWQPHELTKMLRMTTAKLVVDFVFVLSSRKTFESVRSRAARVKVGNQTIKVASLEDIVAAKEAAGRPKDLAVLPMLRNTLRTRRAMEKEST